MTKTSKTSIHSVNLGDLSLAQLIQVSQGLGHDIAKLQQQRRHLRSLIHARIAAGESEHAVETNDKTATAGVYGMSGEAPGAYIVVDAQ